jgi:hypothetical protein
MIQFNLYASLLCKEVVSHKYFEHTLLYAEDFFFLLEAESGNSKAIFQIADALQNRLGTTKDCSHPLHKLGFLPKRHFF